MAARFPASLRVIGRSVVDWWDGWLNMVMVIAVWLLASLTLVLAGPATFGVYYAVYSMVNGEAMGVVGMFQGAKKYFWKSMIWALINVAVGLLAWVNIQFYAAVTAYWARFVQAFEIMLTVLWISTQFYALPFFMEQEVKSLRRAFKNGFFTTMAAPFYSIVLLIFAVIVAGLSVGFVIPLFLGLPGLIPVLGFRAMYERLESFGLREREKTPKELEFEEGANSVIPSFERQVEEPRSRSRRAGRR